MEGDLLGKYEQAEPLYRRALKIYEQQLGSNHEKTRQLRSELNAILTVKDQ